MNKIISCIALILLLFAIPSASGSQDEAGRIERIENGLLPTVVIDTDEPWNIEQRMQHYGVPGLAVAVIEDFEIAWIKGYGVIDAEKGDVVTEETMFQAASITKPVTAAVALKLTERGALDLDEDVNIELRSWKVPENEFTKEKKVTIRGILNHTAGTTVHGFRGYAEYEQVPTIIQVLNGEAPSNSDSIRVDKVPGESYRYSGGGTTILQLLLEDVTGRPLHELADEFVLEPLGMERSSIEKPLPAELEAKTSKGHLRDGTVITGYSFLPAGSGCCGLWTTPADLSRFGIELSRAYRGESNRILSQESASLMVSPSSAGNVGLGMFIEQREGEIYFQHGGGNVGFKCQLIMHREDGYGAAVMTNGDHGGNLCQEIIYSIAKEYGWAGLKPLRFESFDSFIDHARNLREENPQHPEISEASVNRYGYWLLGEGQYDRAIAILALNVDFYPESANCYDSLAEAYLTKGDKERAIELYKKALEVLEEYAEENARYSALKESIPRRLEELGAGGE
jgi:CubicO group peptidase (beta-lactamase class C family)